MSTHTATVQNPTEPGKARPGVVLGDPTLLDVSLGVLTVVPLTGDERLAIPALSIPIEPTAQNGLKKRSFALAWNAAPSAGGLQCPCTWERSVDALSSELPQGPQKKTHLPVSEPHVGFGPETLLPLSRVEIRHAQRSAGRLR